LVLVVNPAITYGLFERFKDTMYPNVGSLSPGQAFFVGAASKTVATIVTYPYIMAKVRMQFKPSKSAGEEPEFDRKDGAIQILQKIYRKSGFLGWYQVRPPLEGTNVGVEHADFEGGVDTGHFVLF
jgi:solute carrier family 25 (peroxisomal adenine nucleotide transporter), member 17